MTLLSQEISCVKNFCADKVYMHILQGIGEVEDFTMLVVWL